MYIKSFAFNLQPVVTKYSPIQELSSCFWHPSTRGVDKKKLEPQSVFHPIEA